MPIYTAGQELFLNISGKVRKFHSPISVSGNLVNRMFYFFFFFLKTLTLRSLLENIHLNLWILSFLSNWILNAFFPLYNLKFLLLRMLFLFICIFKVNVYSWSCLILIIKMLLIFHMKKKYLILREKISEKKLRGICFRK